MSGSGFESEYNTCFAHSVPRVRCVSCPGVVSPDVAIQSLIQMVRKLKFHERKLLKRVDFINWDDKNLKEIAIMKQYCITRPEYTA